jgi:hypothetical protein
VLAAGTGDASGTGDVSAVVELVVVVHAVSTADAQPRANARRDNWGSDEGEGGEVFKEFSCDAAGTSVERGDCSGNLVGRLVKPSSEAAHDKT